MIRQCFNTCLTLTVQQKRRLFVDYQRWQVQLYVRDIFKLALRRVADRIDNPSIIVTCLNRSPGNFVFDALHVHILSQRRDDNEEEKSLMFREVDRAKTVIYIQACDLTD